MSDTVYAVSMHRHALGLVFALAACDPSAVVDDAGPETDRDARGLDASRSDDARSADDAARDAPGDLDVDVTLDAAISLDASGSDAPPDAPSRCPSRPTLGLFVWGDDLVTRRDEILTLASETNVTEIYLHANLFYAGDEDDDVLADWIRAADASCIAVELLFGNGRWILPAGQTQATSRTDWSVAFAAAHPDARPSGVHWDLEPQQLDEWDVEADRPTLIAHLADVLERMTPVAEAGGLPLSVDMGFFLDGYDVTRGGRTRTGNAWITDAVSRVVLMDYRDSAASMGFGGMISLAEDEVTYAVSAATPIVLAVETIPVSPEYVTFREEGRAVLFSELALVNDHFGARIAGFAIHDEDGFRALGP